MDIKIEALVAVFVLAALHLTSRHLKALESGFGKRFGAVAEGALLAYVVVDLLPAVSEAESEIGPRSIGAISLSEPAWLACLGGMVLLTFAQAHRRHPAPVGVSADTETTAAGGTPAPATDPDERADAGVDAGVDAAFILMTGAHVLANIDAGLLLQHHHYSGVLAHLPVTVLLAVHLALVAREHETHHAEPYRRFGRPALAAALLLGGVVGSFWDPSGSALSLLRAGLAGLLALNVLQNHIRQQHPGRAPGFIVGSLAYGTALALL